MANNGEFIEGLSASAITEIKAFVLEVEKGAKAVENINKAFANTRLPSSNRNAISEANTEMARSNVIMTEAEKITNRINIARTAEALEVAKLKLELAGLNAENKRAASEAMGTLNSYQKLSGQLNTLRLEVKGVATDMYLLETAGKKNSAEYRSLSSTYEENIKKVTKLDEVLKKIDASTGQHQRNVGNYASGYNGLNNSIQQILREAPAAAVSLNTFFLGISNNLPMFFDEISKVTAETKAFREAQALANAEIAATTTAQQQAVSGFQQADRALKANVGTILSSLDITAAQRTSIREQIAVHKIETKTLGQATAATMAKTESILLNAGATREQVAIIISQIEAQALASRTSAEQTALLNAQTAAQLEANAAATASPSLWARLGASIFSVQTLLTVGVLALTLYGGKLIELAKDFLALNSSMDPAKKSMQEINAIRVSSLKAIVKETLELDKNIKAAKNVTISYKEREIAAKKVLDQYPFWFEALGKEAILNGNVEKAVNGVKNALLSRAKADAALTKITENQTKVIDLEEERLVITERLRASEERLRADRSRTNAASASEDAYQKEVNSIAAVNRQKGNLEKINKRINDLEEINRRLLGYTSTEYEKSLGLDYKVEKQKKEKIKRIKEENDINQINQKGSLSLIAIIENEIRKTEELRNALSKNSSEYEFFNKRIDDLKYSLTALIDVQSLLEVGAKKATDKLEKQAEAAEKTEQRMEELRFQTKLFAASMASGFLSDVGLGSLNFFTEITSNGLTAFDTLMAGADTTGKKLAVVFKAVGDVVKDAYGFINQNQEAQFNAQYARLEKEKDIAIQFAGESSTAKAEIERQYEERRREIDQRKAESDKQRAIFNTVVNTAQAIVGALATLPSPTAVPLSIAVGAIGAAQIALISAQQTPQYEFGTDYHPGGKAIVGDGGRHEFVYQPSRGFSVTPKTDTLVDLEKGSKVYPDFNSFLKNSGAMLGGIPNIQLESSGASASEIDSIMGKYFSSISTNEINIDKEGFNTYTSKRQSRIKQMNNNVRGKGFSV